MKTRHIPEPPDRELTELIMGKPASTSTSNHERNHHMKTKPLFLLALTVLAVGALQISPLAFGQTEMSPTPVASAPIQASPSQQMQGMDSNSDSMKQMAEMCMRMMQSEKAAMPYIIGISVLFGLLLFIALVLFIVLEIQWIKYWSRILMQNRLGSAPSQLSRE